MTNNPKIIPVNPSTTEPIIGESINVNHLPNKTIIFDSTKLKEYVKEYEEREHKLNELFSEILKLLKEK